MPMQSERWNRIQDLFNAALEREAAERAAFLAAACAGDRALLDEVQSLLEADAKADTLWTRLRPAAPDPAPETQRTEQEIGPYRVISQIGAGGMGVVYRARDTRLERDVALKLLPAHLKIDQNVCQRFLAEARAASRLDHPNICVIYDVGETQHGQLYMAMPYYTGETLEQRIAREPLSAQAALRIGVQVAEGLAAAHQKGIVHRDIKPANVMLTDGGGVKVLDFGVAKVDGINLTSTGLSIGTLSYMAPEQLMGERVDASADIWSFGATLYEMLTGQRAFAGGRVAEIMQAVLNPQTHAERSLPASIPAPLEPIIQRALNPDLTQRYANAEALLADLREVVLDGEQANPRVDAGWDAQTLARLTDLLMPQIGPIAPVLVRRLATTVSTLPALCARLADHLPDSAAREAFLREAMPAGVTTAVTATRQAQAAVPGHDPQQLARIEAFLTPVLGPIASTLVRRQAVGCRDFHGLCRILADYLPDEQSRAQFLRQMKLL